MSVQLRSADDRVDENLSNETWAAIVALARAYEGDRVPDWNGFHDGLTWTSEQLTLMADRLRQTAAMEPIIRALAKHGGATIS